MDVIEAIHSWRTIRSFADIPVDRSEIADLLWHAIQVSTPPANDVPWALCVVEGRARIEELGIQAMDFARAQRPPGEPGWSWVDRPGFRVFWGAPALVLICARIGNAAAPFDCCRAGQNLVLAAHQRGLGTCWLGAPLPWLMSAGVAERLGVPPGFEPSVVMALGRPAERPEPKSRPHPEIVWCEGV
jgi:nitroreductase